MIYVPNESVDPHFNLALEEYVLKEMDAERYILLWQNSPSVIVGRFQNTLGEINLEYVTKHRINVVRRITGGGAVYHDLGNLNFTFIEPKTQDPVDLGAYSRRIARALQQMGLNVEVSGRNDVTIDGKKFSGNAQYIYRGRVLHHGTILYDSNLDNLEAALNVKPDKMTSKGVKSVRQRVANLIDYMPRRMSLAEFKTRLLEQLFDGEPIRVLDLSEDQIAAVRELVARKYGTWEWNYGESPDYNRKAVGRFSWGGIELYLKVNDGRIQSCKIYGDFFTNENVSDLEAGLCGIQYDEEGVTAAYYALDVPRYFENMQLDEFLRLVLSQ
ncbi:MAG TPA: lipoate--protein ligase [Firmicutes bacterium]|nr:lipoate--protein ligase [Bacillota bacterium]